MTNTSDSRVDHAATGDRLAAAAEAIAGALPPSGVRTAFSFEEKAYIRAFADHEVRVSRNESMGAWVVSCARP